LDIARADGGIEHAAGEAEVEAVVGGIESGSATREGRSYTRTGSISARRSCVVGIGCGFIFSCGSFVGAVVGKLCLNDRSIDQQGSSVFAFI